MQNPYEFDCLIKNKNNNNNKRKYEFAVDVSKNSLEHKFKHKLVLDFSLDDKDKATNKRKDNSEIINKKGENQVLYKRMKNLCI